MHRLYSREEGHSLYFLRLYTLVLSQTNGSGHVRILSLPADLEIITFAMQCGTLVCV